jgi:IS5 family transposase
MVPPLIYLRRFTRIHEGPMMNFTTLCSLRNAIRSETWKKLNAELAKVAVEREQISEERLRLDTTAVETNIHWPADSSLMLHNFGPFTPLLLRAAGREAS